MIYGGIYEISAYGPVVNRWSADGLERSLNEALFASPVAEMETGTFHLQIKTGGLFGWEAGQLSKLYPAED
jgi:hypothetical protein